MATVAPAGRLSPCTQFERIVDSFDSLLSSLCESTDQAFRRVQLMKRDEQGNIKLYNKKDPVTGVVRKDALVSYIEDIKTGDLYLDEPESIVSFKCALITMGLPFYTLTRMGWHAVKAPIEIGTIALDTLFKLGQHFREGHFADAASALKSGCVQILETLGNGLFEIVKAPIFMLGCELAVIYGIFKPYHGRKFESIIENAWQKGVSWKEDFVSIPARPGESCWEAFRKDITNAHTLYLARCFQVRGNVSSPRISVIQRTPL